MITGIDRPTPARGRRRHGLHNLSESQLAVWRGRTSASSSSSSSCCPRSPRRERDAADGFLRACGAEERLERAMKLLEQVELADRRTSCRRSVGRPAAARGHRPRPRQRPADHRGRRAHRQPGLQVRPSRSSSCSALVGRGQDDPHGHPRPRARGAGRGEPCTWWTAGSSTGRSRRRRPPDAGQVRMPASSDPRLSASVASRGVARARRRRPRGD